MKSGRSPRMGFLPLALAFGISLMAWIQVPLPLRAQMTTEDRVKRPGWWPTKGTPRRDGYAGSERCAECHASTVSSQKNAGMARTAIPTGRPGWMQGRDQRTFELDSHTYRIQQTPGGIVYSASDGAQSISSTPLAWTFGSGDVGESYLFEKKGTFEEARFSYFRALEGFDTTPNQTALPANSLEAALGRPVVMPETGLCFGCHTTAATVKNRFDPKNLIPGVTCEACHGPGARHAAEMKARRSAAGMRAIVNPGDLDPVDSVDFCGSCHETYWDVVFEGTRGLPTLRDQPYRLENSRCWGKEGDIRITCVACHDPHQPLNTDSAYYDQRCLSCHLSKADTKPLPNRPGAACPVSTKDCVSCHMPSYELPSFHHKFTDHWIRIVRTGEKLPG